MRDPLSWSIPLFRAFGIQVRLHILYIIITLGLILRAVHKSPDNWHEFVLIFVVLLFVIVLLHEFGHCFAAHHEGGDANEILMWPLGGLAYCDVPHVARAHFITAAGGPMVNVMICLVCTLALLPYQLLPPLNPFNNDQIFAPQLHRWSDGATVYKAGDYPFVKEGTNQIIPQQDIDTWFRHGDRLFVKLEGKPKDEAVAASLNLSVPHYNQFVLWTARLFWLSWVLFLLNLLPAFPLDGGRLLQSFLWGRTGDYRRATMTAIYAGFTIGLLFLLVSFWITDPLLLGMAIFIWVFCRQQYVALEMSETESAFGYDFSQGYTSLERDEPPRPRPKKQSFIKRWLQARRERKALLEAEQRAADEARLDNLLEKIHRQGKESLTEEERRFMDRVSDRYRNRS